ncbi:hypothetical protein QTT91_002859 [Salmonella enterica]|uniref:Uncharacterized protein n=2 Tax=Salmonella enterica TaxID=28901 RepID=A0A8F7UAK6_SALER|nr:hypothetical protein [Salmonella enterica]EJV3033681.1 hypothetical protein [Salmonella enterica]ELP5625508.1 hypothetical protein [Salmonella enterica]QXX10818.1 hypothetical protein JMJ87_19210 [Salmonella enterica]QXX22984.1 hypothetical protein JMJ83_11555 [Salmonella enterica subsp. salamae]
MAALASSANFPPDRQLRQATGRAVFRSPLLPGLLRQERKPAGFTSCELLLQPPASTLSSISVGLYFCQLFISSFPFFICGVLTTLFFRSFGYFMLQCGGRISKVSLRPWNFQDISAF